VRRAPELWLSLALMVAAVGGYLVIGPVPPGSHLGHALGITGAVLMLATEVLYTIRKRAKDRAWGPMARWLRIHIVTGLVGPLLVGLHAAGHWHGVGGWAAIATAVVVASGFTGRYLYTAIPRAPSGTPLTGHEIDAALSNAELRLTSADLGARARRRITAESARLRRRSGRLEMTRRLLARWHTFHVPLTLALFTLVVIHVVVALYYGAGMH
jgi:hypothetical protein